MVSINGCWKKLRAKQPLSEGQELEFREKQLVKYDDSMVFTLDQMMEATQNFSHIIGRTVFGKVFFGKLLDGRAIAVKVVSLHEGVFEIDLLSRVHHKNLVALIGSCDESEKLMLIYNYMSEGSLSDRLYDQSARVSTLNWKTRLKIAIDAAEGLQYLHICCTPMIIHRDVKTSNIILDGDLNGKLVNFGFSMMTMDRKAPVEDIVKGTYGYADPEYVCTGVLTQKSDVYSFGVVLLEMICGRKAVDQDLPSQERLLSTWVKENVGIHENPGKLVEIIDKKMDGNHHMKSITIVVKLALRCLQNSSLRPCMSEVVGELKEAFMYEKVKLLSIKEPPVAKHTDSRSGCQFKSEDDEFKCEGYPLNVLCRPVKQVWPILISRVSSITARSRF